MSFFPLVYVGEEKRREKVKREKRAMQIDISVMDKRGGRSPLSLDCEVPQTTNPCNDTNIINRFEF